MNNLQSSYLDLLKKSLTDFYNIDRVEYAPLQNVHKNWKYQILLNVDKLLRKKGLSICTQQAFTIEDRMEGKDWPQRAETMIGVKRLDNLELCLLDIISNNIDGDVIETGVWRGGATIYMRAILEIANVTDKTIWVADSFEGLPKPNPKEYPADKGDEHYLQKRFSVSLKDVESNFNKFNLLDNQVKFLKGWFKDTLPTAPIEKLSLLRIDGDMYESTMDALTNLYPKLSIGGYIIIDDWGAVKGCKAAVEDYRKTHGINEEIVKIDWTGVYWKKAKN